MIQRHEVILNLWKTVAASNEARTHQFEPLLYLLNFARVLFLPVAVHDCHTTPQDQRDEVGNLNKTCVVGSSEERRIHNLA